MRPFPVEECFTLWAASSTSCVCNGGCILASWQTNDHPLQLIWGLSKEKRWWLVRFRGRWVESMYFQVYSDLWLWLCHTKSYSFQGLLMKVNSNRCLSKILVPQMTIKGYLQKMFKLYRTAGLPNDPSWVALFSRTTNCHLADLVCCLPPFLRTRIDWLLVHCSFDDANRGKETHCITWIHWQSWFFKCIFDLSPRKSSKPNLNLCGSFSDLIFCIYIHVFCL